MNPSIMLIFLKVKGGYNNTFQSCTGVRPVLVEFHFSSVHCYAIFWFITVESSLLVGTNIRGVRMYSFPSNLHPNERIYNHLCNSFIKSIPITLPTNFRPPKPGKYWIPTNINPHE